MIKTTAKELKREANFQSREELINYLKDNDLKVVGDYPKRVAYCETIYGCGGFLLQYQLSNGLTVTAFTGRSLWMYSCENYRELGNEYYTNVIIHR
jgi:hypothetical protein